MHAIKGYLIKCVLVIEYFLSKLAGLFGIQLAPLMIPLERRLQTLAALGWIFMFLFGGITGITLCVLILRSEYYWLSIIYILYIVRYREIYNTGGQRMEWFRKCKWFQYFRDYFPIKLIKTEDLDPNRNYLMVSYPHGVLVTGGFGAFCTDACDFPNIFPGLTPHMLLLEGNFLSPIIREFFLWLGASSASATNINFLLDPKNGEGKCVVLFVGGAAESLNCHADSGEHRIVLKNRKGFVKLAMKHGTPLVPVFSFGELELYEQANNPKGSKFREWQDWLRGYLGFAPIIPLGRGIFQYTFGIVPRRRPVTVVVGKPIEVTRNTDPSNDQIDQVHKQFIQKLIELFEEGKNKYLSDPDRSTLIID